MHENTLALYARREWMTMMGFSEEEIEEHCDSRNNANLEEELEQLEAALEIEKLRTLTGEDNDS